MTCNDCGREIEDCDRYGCREVRGVAWARYTRDEVMNPPVSAAQGTEARNLTHVPPKEQLATAADAGNHEAGGPAADYGLTSRPLQEKP